MSDPAIKVTGLGKRYRLRHKLPAGRYRTLREDLLQLPSRLWASAHGAGREEFWALRDVSFELEPGEVVGVIGRNGAGKSTLLKILSRITPPTVGEVEIFGRVGSLLEVGTGFHPELTGRENIFLSGAILGMRRPEIRRRFDEIVAFAGVEKFLDTPCKHYSSGMYLRLGFAVAAHLDAEILLVDEVLAVGDAEFQRKCLGKMGEVASGGRTVLLVSHHLNVIQKICHAALLLDSGVLVKRAAAAEVIDAYLKLGSIREGKPAAVPFGQSDRMAIHAVQTQGIDGAPRSTFTHDEAIQLRIDYEVYAPLNDLRIGLQLLRGLGEVAFASTDHRERGGARVEIGRYRSSCEIPGELLNLGRYGLVVWAGTPGREMLIPPSETGSVVIEGRGNHGSDYADAQNWPGVVCPRLTWRVERTD
jgi:lipopolysaccharide transport system ATP-binding protein